MAQPMPERHHVAMLVRNRYTNDTRVEKEARTLVDAGHRVTVLADAGPGLPELETRDGSEIMRVARRGARLPGLRFVLHELRLARRLRATRPTVLHAHDSNALVPVALAARSLRVPYVYDAHDLWLGRPRRERSRLYFALNQLYYRLVERLLVPRAAATITVSQPIVEHLRGRYRLRRVALVPNYPDINGDVDRRELRGLPGGEAIDPDTPVVLYIGGLMAGRGLEQLVDAIGLVPSVQLVLLGSGVLEGPLLARAVERGARVHLLAPVAPSEVEAYAASAGIGVSPIVGSCLNYRYSLPNKLFQYMAAGIPVVASDFPQVHDIVEGARCGLIADTRRPGAIADAIRRILADPDEAAAMGARGRAAVADRFNWSASASVLREVYDTIEGPTRR
jgi:glycosyltransferase involved in cell wall biosynthesis